MGIIMPDLVSRLYNRWQKRVFANDDIFCQPSKEGEGYWEVGINRENRQVVITIAPNAYCNPRFMLDADAFMRFALKSLKEKNNAL